MTDLELEGSLNMAVLTEKIGRNELYQWDFFNIQDDFQCPADFIKSEIWDMA